MPKVKKFAEIANNPKKSQSLTGKLTKAQINKQREKLVRNKAITTIIAKTQLNIIEENSELKTQLERRIKCKSIYIKDKTGLHGSRCEKRTCITCSNIRTTIRINRFKPIIEKWENIYMVTLTIKNVKAEELRKTLIQMNEAVRKITHNKTIRRKDKYLIYIRSTEITINQDTNEFHPHIHLITPSEEQGNYMIDQWLRINEKSNRIAQNIKKADINTISEIFKYIAKVMEKEPRLLNDQIIKLRVRPEQLNIIEKATRKIRLTTEAGIKRYCNEINFNYKEHINNEKNYKLKEGYKENESIPKGIWKWNEYENMYIKQNQIINNIKENKEKKENKKENKKEEEERLSKYRFDEKYKIKII